MLPATASVMTQAISSPYSQEGGPHGGHVVVGQHDRVGGVAPVTPGCPGRPKVATPGAGGGQQRVDVAVVAAGELDHLGPAGEAAGQPDRAHRRLGAAADQAHLLDRRDPGDDLLGQQHLALGRGAERGPVVHRVLDRVEHVGVRVAEDHRPPRADQVDVLAAVGVPEVGAVAADHEPRRAADRPEGPHRRVDPAGVTAWARSNRATEAGAAASRSAMRPLSRTAASPPSDQTLSSLKRPQPFFTGPTSVSTLPGADTDLPRAASPGP